MMSQKESGTWLVKLGGEAERRGAGGSLPRVCMHGAPEAECGALTFLSSQ